MATAKKIHSVGHVAKRAGKPTEVVLKTADSEAKVREDVAACAARLKLVRPKSERVGELTATDEQDEILNDAASIAKHAAELKKEAERLENQAKDMVAPLGRLLDARKLYELTGTRYKLRVEAYESSIAIKPSGASYRLRDR